MTMLFGKTILRVGARAEAGGGAATSLAAQMVRHAGTPLPTSFDGDGRLYGLNLFLMTAFMCLGLMLAASMARGDPRATAGPTARATRSPSGALAWMLAGAGGVPALRQRRP